MNRTAKILLASGGLLVASYPGVAWLTGLIVEHRIEGGERQLSHRVPYLTIVKRDYQRGIYRSSEAITYRIREPVPPAPKLSQAAAAPSFTVTVRNTIQHGPFPGLSTFALATFDSTLVLPERVREQISRVIGLRSIARMHTRISWLANTRSTITMPPFNWRAADGSTLDWRGLSAVIESDRDFSSWSGHITVPELALRTADGGYFKLLRLSFSGRARRAFDTLFVGRSRIAIDQLDGTDSRAGDTYMLRHIAVGTATDVHGAYLDTGFTVTTDAARFGKMSLSHVVYAASFEHLHGPTLNRLSRALRDVERNDSGEPTLLEAGVLQALHQYGTELLLHDPAFKIRKATFTMPEGTFVLSASASAPGLSPADLGWPALIPALKTHGQVTADLRIDNALLRKFVTGRGTVSRAADRIAALERAGYLSIGANAVTTHLHYAAGRLTLNDKPFPAAAPVN